MANPVEKPAGTARLAGKEGADPYECGRGFLLDTVKSSRATER